MADSLKNEWKETGKGLGKAFQSLGKSIARSAIHGVSKAAEWANEGVDTQQAPVDENNVIDAEVVRSEDEK